jgi:hypothetical protein
MIARQSIWFVSGDASSSRARPQLKLQLKAFVAPYMTDQGTPTIPPELVVRISERSFGLGLRLRIGSIKAVKRAINRAFMLMTVSTSSLE